MVCPKCGTPIKRFDLSPNCKNCGVHIMYYTQEQDLTRDAKRTELEFANARSIVAKLKGNFVAGKVPVARIVFCVLSIAVLCIPFFSIKMKMPMSEISISTGAIGAYNIYSSSVYSIFLDLFKVKIGGALTVVTALSIVLFVLVVLITAADLIVWILSFINIKKSAKALTVLCIPFFSIKMKMPMSEISISTGAIGAYNIYSSSVYSIFLDLFKVKIGGALTVVTALSIVLFVLVVLITAADLIVWILSFINIKKSAKALTVLSFIGAALDIAAFACMLAAKSMAGGMNGVAVSFCFGSLASAAMLVVFGILNINMVKNGAPLPLSDVDMKRIELYKQFKAKKLDLDTLPLPIYETAEEREKRENALAGAKKENKEGGNNG